MSNDNRKKSSAAVLVEIRRLEYLTELLTLNIEGMKERAERGESTWAHQGDAANLVARLAELAAEADKGPALIAEIDREIADNSEVAA